MGKVFESMNYMNWGMDKSLHYGMLESFQIRDWLLYNSAYCALIVDNKMSLVSLVEIFRRFGPN